MKKTILLTALFIGANLSALFAQFETFTPPQSFEIRGMHSAFGKGKIALATDAGVFWFEKSSKTWESFTTTEGLPSNDVRCLQYTEDNKLYLGLGDGSVGYIFNNTWTTISAPNNAGEIITAIQIRTTRDTAYGSSSGNLHYKTGASSFASIPISNNNSKITAIHALNGVPGQPEILIAPSEGSGILLYAPVNSFSFIVNSQGSPLPSDNVISNDVNELKSYDGTDKGLYIADFSTFPQVTPTLFTANNSMLPSDIIAAIEVNAGLQWFGTPAGLAHKNGDNWKVFTTSNSNLPSNNIKQLYIDHNDDGSLWIATADGKLSRLEDYGLSTKTINNTLEVNYYPNPAHTSLTIELGELPANKTTLTITDVLGKEVLKTNLQLLSTDLNISHLKSGVYMLSVYSAQGVFTQKINVQ
jgi:ligand-binding sensor domain-containing protein